MTLTRTIIVCIDEIMTHKCISWEGLAQETGIHPNRVQEIFSGFITDKWEERNLTVRELEKIVKALDLNADDVELARRALPMWVWRGFASRAFSSLSDACSDVAGMLDRKSGGA